MARTSEHTYRDMKRVGLAFFVGVMVLLVLTVVAIMVDHRRPWRVFRAQWVGQVEPWMQSAREYQREIIDGDASDDASINAGRDADSPHRSQRSRWPIIDAIGRTETVDQIEPSGLAIDFHFRDVPRVDRCVSCHRGIASTARDRDIVSQWTIPGVEPRRAQRLLEPVFHIAERPAWPSVESLRLTLPEDLPGSGLRSISVASSDSDNTELLDRLGFSMTRRSVCDLLDREVDDTAASRQVPDEQQPSLQNASGLVGATVQLVIPESAAAQAGLEVGDRIVAVENGSELLVRRGLPEPLTSHPRLDLYVGATSPHPIERFGCTACHAGQGLATGFDSANHTPDRVKTAERWQAEYGWTPADPEFNWDRPMLPDRFIESSCLACHHDLPTLESSREFTDAAPKLIAGYHLVRQYGCFGCHEINGQDTDGRQIGPDMRLEPSNAASKMQSGEPNHSDHFGDEQSQSGRMRRVGSSLLHLAEKLDRRYLYDWIMRPTSLNPTTRMPTVYGHSGPLDGVALDELQEFEPVEIAAMTEYLLSASVPVDMKLEGVWGSARVESARADVAFTNVAFTNADETNTTRGHNLFALQGCVACHQVPDYPQGTSTFGPDLSRIGTKLDTPIGRRWLNDWLTDPARYSPQTLMPNSMLTENATNDLSVYLLTLRGPTLADQSAIQSVPTIDPAAVDRLAMLGLERSFTPEQATEYLRDGVPTSMLQSPSSDAVELVADADGIVTLDMKLRYVGRSAIRRRGCFGCHEIRGMTDAQPIGPELTGWGRKRESLLGFDRVSDYLASDVGRIALETDASLTGVSDGVSNNGSEGVLEADQDQAFYVDAVNSQRREGFIWQKLREPRSFDYRVAETKSYSSRLTMGQFDFTPVEREAIVTFILGLTGERPGGAHTAGADPLIEEADHRHRVIGSGRRAIDQFGCAECHVLEMPRWTVRYDPATFESPYPMPQFEFMRPVISDDWMTVSGAVDRRGDGRATIAGRPMVDQLGQPLLDEDWDGNPTYVFTLWEPAAVNRHVWAVGGQQMPVVTDQLIDQQPAWGGRFTDLLLPIVAEQNRVKQGGPFVPELWGKCPPPLVREGAMVRPDWLYQFLLNPSEIRPNVELRMPRFTLSRSDARALTDYFAAVAGSDYPYTVDAISVNNAITPNQAFEIPIERLDQAWRVLTDRTTFCAKCHAIGEYQAAGSDAMNLAPNLADVSQRIRPEYLRRWIASPKSIVPYTGMPTNFPPEGPALGQDLLPGESREQITVMVELLTRLNWYLARRATIGTGD